MADTHYIAPSTGDDANWPATSELTPMATWAGVTWIAGDTYSGLGGDIALETIAPDASGTLGNEITINSYGTGQHIVDGELTRDYALNIESQQHFIVDNLEIRNGLVNSFRIASDFTANRLGYTLTNLNVHGARQATGGGAAQGTGLFITTSSATASIGGIVIDSCNFYSNAYHGLNLRGYIGSATITNCRAYSNSTHRAGQGFTTHPYAATWTTPAEWTNEVGTVWSHAMVTSNDPMQTVKDLANDQILTYNPGATTTIGVGEWDYTTAKVYVNLGEATAPTEIYTRRHPMPGPIVFESCEAYLQTQVGGNEGMGFVFDDLSENCTAHACKAYNNEGNGFRTNKADDCKFVACISYDNGLDNFILSQTSADCHVYHGVADGAARYGVSIFSSFATCSVKNTIAVNSVTDDIWLTTGSAVESNNVESPTDPLFLDAANRDYRLTQASPCRGAGTFISFSTRDYRGRVYNIPPSIGAYEVTSRDPADTRTTAETSNLLVNGSFDSDLSSWTTELSTASWDAGRLKLDSDFSAIGIRQDLRRKVRQGERFKVDIDFEVGAFSISQLKLQLTDDTTGVTVYAAYVVSADANSSGSISTILEVDSTDLAENLYFRITFAGTGRVCWFDNVSVKQIRSIATTRATASTRTAA